MAILSWNVLVRTVNRMADNDFNCHLCLFGRGKKRQGKRRQGGVRLYLTGVLYLSPWPWVWQLIMWSQPEGDSKSAPRRLGETVDFGMYVPWDGGGAQL